MVPWTVGKGVGAQGEPWEVRFDERGVLRGVRSEEGQTPLTGNEQTWRIDYARAAARARAYQSGEPPWPSLPPGWEADYRGVEELAALAADKRTVRVRIWNVSGVWMREERGPDGEITQVPNPKLGLEPDSKFWDACDWLASGGFRVARVAWCSREAARMELVVRPPYVRFRVHLAAPDWNPMLTVAVWEQPGVLPEPARAPSTLRAAAPRKPPAPRGRG